MGIRLILMGMVIRVVVLKQHTAGLTYRGQVGLVQGFLWSFYVHENIPSIT